MTENRPDLVQQLQANRSYLERQIRERADDVVLAKESISDLIQSISRELVEENGNFEFRGENEFRAWLKRVVASKIIDTYRFYTAEKRDARREQSPSTERLFAGGPDSNTPSKYAMIDEEHEMLATALERLGGDQLAVLKLFWFEQLSHTQIADRMNRTEVATRKLLSRAKAQLGLEIERMKRET